MWRMILVFFLNYQEHKVGISVNLLVIFIIVTHEFSKNVNLQINNYVLKELVIMYYSQKLKLKLKHQNVRSANIANFV